MRRNRRPHAGDQVWQLGFKSSPGSTSDGAFWKGRRRKCARNLEREGDDETRARRFRKRWVEILGIRSTAGITKNSTDGNTISRTPLTRSLMDWEADRRSHLTAQRAEEKESTQESLSDMEDRMKTRNTCLRDTTTGSETIESTKFPWERRKAENGEGELFEKIKAENF